MKLPEVMLIVLSFACWARAQTASGGAPAGSMEADIASILSSLEAALEKAAATPELVPVPPRVLPILDLTPGFISAPKGKRRIRSAS